MDFYVAKYMKAYCHVHMGTVIYFICIRNAELFSFFFFFLADCFICAWDTTGTEEYSANWIIHGNKDTRSQGIKAFVNSLPRIRP